MRALGLRALAASCLVVMVTASPVSAAEQSAGAPALEKARAMWDRGALRKAEPLYRDALEKGGLAPDQVLEGYVRLGAIRASRGKDDQAIAAFRAAAILDEGFTVPSEAGPKGPKLADKARKDTAKIGSLEITLEAPDETPAGKPFTVTVTVDEAHLPIIDKLGLVTKDGTSGKQETLEAKPEASLELEVPGTIALPDASLVVRLDALDKHGNRLASAEQRVRVPGESHAVAAAADTKKPSSSDEGARTGGGFWSSPWPYLIGGVALAGAGAAVYFGTRPPEDVSLGQIGVQAR